MSPLLSPEALDNDLKFLGLSTKGLGHSDETS